MGPDSESSPPPNKVSLTVMVPSSNSSLRSSRNPWKSKLTKPSSKDFSISWTESRKTWKWPKPSRETPREPDKLIMTSSSKKSRLNSCTPKDKLSTSKVPSLPLRTESPPLALESPTLWKPPLTSKLDSKTEVLNVNKTRPFGNNSQLTCPLNSPLLENLCIFWKTRELSLPDMDSDCD